MSNMNNEQEQEKKFKDRIPKKPQLPRSPSGFFWIYIILVVGLIGFFIPNMMSDVPEISYTEFNDLVRDRAVEKIYRVSNENNRLEIVVRADKKDAPAVVAIQAKQKNWRGPVPAHQPHLRLSSTWTEDLGKRITETQLNNNYTAQELIDIQEIKRTSFSDHLGWLLPILLMVVLWVFLMRRMGGGGGSQIFNIGKSRAQLYDKDTMVNVTFNDVAGLEEAKVEIKEIVDFLKHPKKYTDLGAKIPKGALLVGPPGTGKTLLAKAVAGEAKVPFFSLSGSDFVEMFVGVGASRVRDLFKQAKEKSPCIIFIDEIDAIGRARGRSVSQGANDERENTLNQLLTEMDGFGTNSGVIILAATNRADILDRALLRAGRFDRQIYVDLPDLNERKAIFQVHLKPLKLDKALDLDFLAKQTPGFSGADIANICNEAALIAARHNKKTVDKQDFLDAVDRVIGGLEKKNKIISLDEKRIIAFHEAGHATVSWMLKHAAPLVKVTIVPRGRSLGAAWYLPEERQLTTTEQFIDEMCATLGGRAAEDVIFDQVSTGALSDLERVTKQAYAMVMYYGLNDKVGNISFYDSTGQEYSFQKPYSNKTAEVIDEEVKKMVDAAYEKAKQILRDNRSKLEQLAKVLLEREVIFKEDLEQIFGKRPWDVEVKEETPQNTSTPTPTVVGDQLSGEETKKEENNDNPVV
ncbi:MAG: ATP-dependent zinc metalloprotease FtsH [Bacteroidetes bacterium]|jgi:ATP-dependent metalloprotease FtsH|nr:ATP-dependent zinc metalloprotease FtsH [Bacteroidota bacterium]